MTNEKKPCSIRSKIEIFWKTLRSRVCAAKTVFLLYDQDLKPVVAFSNMCDTTFNWVVFRHQREFAVVEPGVVAGLLFVSNGHVPLSNFAKHVCFFVLFSEGGKLEYLKYVHLACLPSNAIHNHVDTSCSGITMCIYCLSVITKFLWSAKHCVLILLSSWHIHDVMHYLFALVHTKPSPTFVVTRLVTIGVTSIIQLNCTKTYVFSCHVIGFGSSWHVAKFFHHHLAVLVISAVCLCDLVRIWKKDYCSLQTLSPVLFCKVR